MIKEVEDAAKKEMDKAIESLLAELKRVRTGRANVSMLDPVMVVYYGTPTPLAQVATLATPDARSFVITPWETNILKDIEMAIVNANLGLAPQNDGKCVRLKVPELTEERRKELVKGIKKTVEDGRVSIRMARRNANDTLKALLKDKEISEDDQKRAGDAVQKLTDSYIVKVDKIAEDKEKELLTI